MIKKLERRNLMESPMCLAIICVNIVVFAALKIAPGLTEMLSLYSGIGQVLQRPWTLVSVIFTHEVSIHILGNMLVLFYFGREMEKRAGSKHLFLIYIISGIVGSLSILIAGPCVGWTEPSMGASAAVLGVLGALTVMPSNAAAKIDVKKVFIVIAVLNIAMLFINLQRFATSSAAHLTGIAAGMVYGYYLKKKNNK